MVNVFIEGLGKKTFMFEVDPDWTLKQLINSLNDEIIEPQYKNRIDHNKFWYNVNGKCIYADDKLSDANLVKDSCIRFCLRQENGAPLKRFK